QRLEIAVSPMAALKAVVLMNVPAEPDPASVLMVAEVGETPAIPWSRKSTEEIAWSMLLMLFSRLAIWISTVFLPVTIVTLAATFRTSPNPLEPTVAPLAVQNE